MKKKSYLITEVNDNMDGEGSSVRRIDEAGIGKEVYRPLQKEVPVEKEKTDKEQSSCWQD